MSSPHERPASGAAWWSAAVQWRNWPLLVKLGVVLVVPVVGALVLGVLRVRADVELADSYASVERVAAVRVQLVRVLSALQHERNEAVGDGAGLPRAITATDAAIADVTDVIGATSGDQARIAGESDYRELVGALGSLVAARGQRAADGDGLVVLSGYNAVTGAVLEFDRSLVGRFPDQNLTNTSIALGELQSVREQVALQQAIGSLALRDNALSDAGRQLMIEAAVRLEDQLGDFRSVAPPALRERYDTTVTGQDVTARQQMVDAARTMGPAQARFTAEQWNTVSDTTTSQLTEVTQLAAADLRAGSDELAERVSDRAGLESVLLLVMLLLAAGVGGGLGRYLLRSVGLLRRAALDVAHQELPAAVASIRAGDGAKVAIEPVPLRTTEEFGQLARAFDAVHDQALRSAAEEAGLRSNLANIFTNLSRRSQGLVERQLRLMEQLEQKTDDPDQLADLFRIDHLATRMRRNNENLMVLSGTGALRRFTEPVPLPDVLRAAISEVEHYERAIVRSAPDIRVVGYAAGDLIRSVSELIENATAFSPPDSVVVVESRLRGDGSVMVDVLDDGVGMGDEELREANHRVTGGGGVDVPVSRQMGLFVVGRLTARHGIRVRLSKRADGGLCASVLVPAALVGVDGSELVPVAAAVPTGAVAGRLESAGITVTLPDLPSASTPASILFAADEQRPYHAVTGFAWLGTPASGAAQAGPRSAPVVEAGPDGLPKRVPKGQLLAPPARPQPSTNAKRDAARARGFLSGFQSGIRQSEKRRGEAES
ncbi:nitrate- and nitrite sensing domain-containing protein [Actinophytocola glycyrrhizae]|uniref:histidine kinase n=1 Tax=Actinophytocola glycyrrhizae TaxID=2044873 RepID=A0ABV9S3T3_9PSEU